MQKLNFKYVFLTQKTQYFAIYLCYCALFLHMLLFSQHFSGTTKLLTGFLCRICIIYQTVWVFGTGCTFWFASWQSRLPSLRVPEHSRAVIYDVLSCVQ